MNEILYSYLVTPSFIHNYLQFRADTWAKSVITFETDKPNRLPFVDVGIVDIGEANQQFSLEIGMACFW